MLVTSIQRPTSTSALELRPAGTRLRHACARHGHVQCCSAASLPPLKVEELATTTSVLELNELLQSHSLPVGDVRTMAAAFRQLTYMVSESPRHFEALGMHEHVHKLCQEFRIPSSTEISLDHAADILGGLEDLVSECDVQERSSIQGCVQMLTDASVRSWDSWYIPDQPCDHTSMTSVMVAVAALSQQPTERVRELAQLTASAFVSILECSAMRNPTMTPTTDVVDLIQSMSRTFHVDEDSEECSGSHSELWQLSTGCRTHAVSQQSAESDEADIRQSSRVHRPEDAQDSVEPLPVAAADERLPEIVRAFVNDACEEIRMRTLPTVHSVNPPILPADLVNLLSALADLKIKSAAVRGCTDAILTLLKYRLKQGLVTSMCPYPYTVSSVSDMSQASEALLKLGHSGILVNEVLNLMLLTLAKIWATPSLGGSVHLSALRRDVGASLEFCGPSVIQLTKNAVAVGVSQIPTVFQLACEPYWAHVSRTQRTSHNLCTEEDEVLATLPQFMAAAKLRTFDTLSICISHALSVCSLSLPIKARNLHHLAVLSSTRSHSHVRNSMNVICDTAGPCDWNSLCAAHGTQRTAVLLSDLLDAALCIYSPCSEPLTVAAAEFLQAKGQFVQAYTAQQLTNCLRLSDVQFSTMSCALMSTTVESSASRVCSLNDGHEHLPLSLCPLCHGHDANVLEQSSVVLAGLRDACVEADDCQSITVDSWENVLHTFSESAACPVAPDKSNHGPWHHRVQQVFMSRELWMHALIFLDSVDHGGVREATAIMLAPHLQSSTSVRQSQEPSSCWNLMLCTALAGPMGRVGSLLQAAGIQGVAVIPTDWIALQAVAQQQGSRSELRRIVDEALSL